MKILSKSALEKVVGFPLESLYFKGQAYDSEGNHEPKICAVTGQQIRYVFTVKTTHSERTRIDIGVVAIAQFRRWNAKLFNDLKVGEAWLMNFVANEQRDILTQRYNASRKAVQGDYNRLIRKAKRTLSDYYKDTGEDWLPKALFLLHKAVREQKPDTLDTQALDRWYAERITEMDAAFAQLSDPSVGTKAKASPAPPPTPKPRVRLIAAKGNLVASKTGR